MPTDNSVKLPQKYVVFKKEDWDNFQTMRVEDDESPEPIDPETHFVLRRDDIFSVPQLLGYSNMIVNLIEAAQALGAHLSGEEMADLMQRADQVADLAYHWQEVPSRRLPT